MLITAVVSGAIVYNLEHDLFENALQQNYALYQKEFATQKLALDTLRLRTQGGTSVGTSDFGAFCAANEALSPKRLDIAGGKLTLASTIAGRLAFLTPQGEKVLSEKINLYDGASTVTFSTTSVPTIARLYVLPPEDGLDGAEEFHYINTALKTLTSIKAIYDHPSSSLHITLPNENVVHVTYTPESGILVNNKIAYNLPTKFPTLNIIFQGLSKDLKTVYFIMNNSYSSTSDMKTGPYALDLASKKITLPKAPADILE
jgi:hypothetical protein